MAAAKRCILNSLGLGCVPEGGNALFIYRVRDVFIYHNRTAPDQPQSAHVGLGCLPGPASIAAVRDARAQLGFIELEAPVNFHSRLFSIIKKCARSERMKARRVFEKAATGNGHYRLDKVYRFLGFALKQHCVRAVRRLPALDYVVDTSKRVHRYDLSERAIFTLLAKSRGNAADEFREYLLTTREAFEANRENCAPEDVERVDAQMKCFMETEIEPATLPERKISDRLASELDGKREVGLGALGVADVVTATELIEVKSVRRWKAAIGQVLVYGMAGAMKNRIKVIHLFGDASATTRATILNVASSLGVLVRFESDLYGDQN